MGPQGYLAAFKGSHCNCFLLKNIFFLVVTLEFFNLRFRTLLSRLGDLGICNKDLFFVTYRSICSSYKEI